ncbi:hypothetical protein H2200_008055 [Cladophialophora chaetospira]|uniref:Uncharacterized protein n=1 Tax=Cladophialophora chaetospira TaxID=386627 RepID=A0AA39CGN4_9EURO|nr:hypothetical protein H2200_008055 [Cladophialophora chaetospira]
MDGSDLPSKGDVSGPEAQETLKSMDGTDSPAEGEVPGMLQDTLNLIRVHIGTALLSLELATRMAQGKHGSRHDAKQHLDSALSTLRQIDVLSSQILDEVEYQEHTLLQRQRDYDWQFDYLTKIKDAIKKSLDWVEDPDDPSTTLDNIHKPDEVADRVDKLFRALRDSVEHFSNLNTALRQDFEKVSQEAARLKEELHVQTKSGQKARADKEKLVKKLADTRTELNAVQDELRQRNDPPRSIDKTSGPHTITLRTLQADLRRANKNLDAQTKKTQEVQTERKTLMAEIQIQMERAEKARAVEEKYKTCSENLRAELGSVNGTSNVLIKNLQNEKEALAAVNTDLLDKNKALGEDLRVHKLQAETANAVKGQEVADLKCELEAAREELRVETRKTQEAQKEKADEVLAFEERLKQASVKHKESLAQLKQERADKAGLANVNQKLELDVKALQADLEVEKVLRENADADYSTMLETASVKHDGIVSGLHQHMEQLRDQLAEVKKEHEEHLRDLVATHASDLLRTQEETAEAREEIAKVQKELDGLRMRTEADQTLIDTLNRAIADRTKEREDMAAMYNSSRTENNRLTQHLRQFVEARSACKPAAASSSVPSVSSEDSRAEGLRHERWRRPPPAPLLPASENNNDAHRVNFQPAQHAPPLSKTSRKRGTAEVEPDRSRDSPNSKRPCSGLGVDRAAGSEANGVSDSTHATSSPTDLVDDPDSILQPAVSSIEHSALILGNLENATQDDVDELLRIYLAAEIPESERKAKVRDIATGLRKLKPVDFDHPAKTLLRAVYSCADDETRCILNARNSLTAGLLGAFDKADSARETILERLCEKWGPFCGVPEKWRAGLQLSTAVSKLQALYNKVAAIGEDPGTYLWKEDGLLTLACNARPGGKLNIQSIAEASQKLVALQPIVEHSRGGTRLCCASSQGPNSGSHHEYACEEHGGHTAHASAASSGGKRSLIVKLVLKGKDHN